MCHIYLLPKVVARVADEHVATRLRHDRTDLKGVPLRRTVSEPAIASAPSPIAAADAGAVSIPLVVGSALLIGIGLLGVAYWLITFRWLYFASLVPLIVGAFLLFTRATGPDHA